MSKLRAREKFLDHDSSKKKVINQTSSNLKLLLCKDSVKEMKRQAIEWEKMFVNHTSNKGSISIIYKECSKVNSRTKQTIH